jgi:cell division protein FtsQ
MDGRRRLAEPVTDAHARAAGAAPARRRARSPFGLIRNRIERYLRRWSGPTRNWRLPRGAGATLATVFLLASVVFGTVRGGHLPVVAAELANVRDAVANALGFSITSIALAGQRHLTREEILTTAGVTGRSSLLFLDAADARARLKANPWIAEATVLKLLPGRLHIKVTERAAFALWQHEGRVAVIAEDGTVLEPYVSRRFIDLPLVVGIGAEARAKAFLALLGQYPLLRERTHAAVLVAERRWNLRLSSGIDVRLPETEVARALDTLMQLDHDKKLLSRDITAVDLRLPDRVTVRLSDEAWAAREETIKDLKVKKKKGGSA